MKLPRFRGGEMDTYDDDDSDGYDNADELNNSSKKNFSSSAALGKYDIKTKRVMLKSLEDEEDLSKRVEAIQKEFSRRKGVQEDGREKDENESILITKRFDECGVSSLTVQALAEAGFEQMTRVQEATLKSYLEGL